MWKWKTEILKSPPHTHTHPPISFLHSKRALLCGCHSNPKANNSPNPFLLPAKKARDENCPNQICPSKRRFSFLTPCHTLNLAPNTRPLACTVSPPSYPHPPPPLFRRGQHYKSIYKLGETLGRRWKRMMADEAYWKTFSFPSLWAGECVGTTSCAAGQEKPNRIFACARAMN